MKCPHCLENFFEEWKDMDPYTISDKDGRWRVQHCTCPSCKRVIIRLGKYNDRFAQYSWSFVRPKGISRSPLPSGIPTEFTDDYQEACLVFTDSPKASAALSRRCLQYLLREKAKTTKRDLSDQIQEVLDSKVLPSYLAESLDAVRNIGNFAAHPLKNKNSGEIVDVEPGEAEWNLDVLEGLFDFYFVQENKLKEKKEKLNQKLQDVGKPPMK
jgi:hypothetical protein